MPKPNLCKQQYVYKYNLYKLLCICFVAYFIACFLAVASLS